MHKQRSTILTGSLGLVAWGGLGVAQALPSYTPIVLNNPTPQVASDFGRSVAGVGDVNGDGVPDVAVGSPSQTVGGRVYQGLAFVLSGATGGLLRTLNNPTPRAGAYFGSSVAGVGDVNGDKVPDVLVGAYNQTVGGNGGQGQAFVFSGATGQRLYTLNNPTPQAYAYFGNSVAGVGDVNGDEVPDLLVGAPSQDVGGNAGQAFVFSGATGRRLYTLNNPTPQGDAYFGASVAGIEDVNGDGVPDLLVGAPGQNQVLMLSGVDRSLVYALDNPMPQGSSFGESVTGIGDVNGDEVPDILVGAPRQKVDGREGQGQAFVFSGATGQRLYTLNTPSPRIYTYFGKVLAGVGDVNGDGVPDLLVGDSRGYRTLVFSGADGKQLLTLNNPTPQANALFGDSVTGVGDVNGDGVPDLLVGAPNQIVGGNKYRGQAFLFVSGPPLVPRWVALNILPKQINVQTQDVLPVAILTTPKFNAAQVDPLSVRLGPGQAQELHRQGHFRDVDGDGDKDLVLHFRTQAVGLGCGDQAVKLIGQTGAGQSLRAVDRLIVVGCQ